MDRRHRGVGSLASRSVIAPELDSGHTHLVAKCDEDGVDAAGYGALTHYGCKTYQKGKQSVLNRILARVFMVELGK